MIAVVNTLDIIIIIIIIITVIKIMLPSHCFVGTIARRNSDGVGLDDEKAKLLCDLKRKKAIISFNLKAIFALLIESNKCCWYLRKYV